MVGEQDDVRLELALRLDRVGLGGQQALLHHLAGSEGPAGNLAANVIRVLDTLDGPS